MVKIHELKFEWLPHAIRLIWPRPNIFYTQKKNVLTVMPLRLTLISIMSLHELISLCSYIFHVFLASVKILLKLLILCIYAECYNKCMLTRTILT